MTSKPLEIFVRFLFISIAASVFSGCASTPIVRESYSEEEVHGVEGGFGVLVYFNPIGQRHGACEISEHCWIFGSPYDVYFQIASDHMPEEDICFESVDFKLDEEILYSSDIGYCAEFRFDKEHGDYRAYKRIAGVSIGFHDERSVIVTLRAKYKNEVNVYKVTVEADKSGKSSSDILRYIYSI